MNLLPYKIVTNGKVFKIQHYISFNIFFKEWKWVDCVDSEGNTVIFKTKEEADRKLYDLLNPEEWKDAL